MAPKFKRQDDTPATTSMAYGVMTPRWHLMRTVLAGTEAMRDAGEQYLPKHQEESDKSWWARLNQATLLNMTELTLDTLAGKPFADPVQFTNDTPDAIEAMGEDINMLGDNLDVYARRWFRNSLGMGLGYTMVDFPRATQPEGRIRTLADDRREGVRPYWVEIAADDVIFMEARIINGKETLTHVRILEPEVTRVGWSEVLTERIRVLEPGRVQMWEKQRTRGAKDEWALVDEWETGLGYIPLVPFYTNRYCLGVAKPPLLDLAHLNVAHWQSSSDQRNILSYARFPMLAMSGVDNVDNDGGTIMKLGPNQVLATRDPAGKFYYVEHQGAAIKAGEEDLRALEDQMAAYGAQFLRKKPGDLKATVRALDSAEALSQLQAMALTFVDALETALAITADWANIDQTAGVVVKTDFGLNDPDEVGWQAIEAARGRRELSRKAYMSEAQRRGWLSDDYDPEEDLKELQDEKEALDALSPMANLDLNAPPEPGPGNPPPGGSGGGS